MRAFWANLGVGLGILLLAYGAAAELINYWRGAWPTALTWILMAIGLLVITIGLGLKGKRAAVVAVIITLLLVITVLSLWLLG